MWQQVQAYFQESRVHLIEATIEGLTESSWRKLFAWVAQQPASVMDQHEARTAPADLSAEAVWREEAGYLISVQFQTCYQSLLALEKTEIESSVDGEGIETEADWQRYCDFIAFIAQLCDASEYRIYLEDAPEQPLVLWQRAE